MVFSSVPVYLDPNNWQQQPTNPPGNVNNNHQNHSQLPLPSQTTQVNESAASPNASSGLRPSSMADRARQAKLPQPEQVLMRCPRCDSTNTKFCYFNNYSLSQPRHFCKTCRRYWTRGGALRNVPVGGGCRRTNKRISSISKSSGTSDQLMRQTISHNSSTSNNSTSFTTTSDQTLGHMTPQSQPQYPHQLPFTSSNLHHFTNPMEMNFSGEMLPSSFSQVGVGLIEHDMDDFMGSTYRGVGGCGSGYGSRGGGGNILSSGGGEQWKLPQMHHFPFLAGLLEPPLGLYPFQGDYQGGLLENMSHQVRTRPSASSVIVSQLGSVKMEENQAASLNLSRQLVGMSNNHSYNQGQRNDQYWSGNAWKDVSGLTSSSTTHLL